MSDSIKMPVFRAADFVTPRDASSERVLLDYDDADLIIHTLRQRFNDYSELFDSRGFIAADGSEAEFFEDDTSFFNMDAVPNKSYLSKNSQKSLALDDRLLKLGDFVCAIRPSFTICAQDESYGIKLPEGFKTYSKLWVRMILIGDLQNGLRKNWSCDLALEFAERAEEFYEHSRPLIHQSYANTISEVKSQSVELEVYHSLSMHSHGVNSKAFNRFIREVPRTQDLIVRPVADFDDDLNSVASFVSHLWPSCAVSSDCYSATKIIDKLREKQTEDRQFKLVTVDDGIRNRGMFVGSFTPEITRFVGVAVDDDKNFDTEEEFGKDNRLHYLYSSEPANNISTILGLDIASGL